MEITQALLIQAMGLLSEFRNAVFVGLQDHSFVQFHAMAHQKLAARLAFLSACHPATDGSERRRRWAVPRCRDAIEHGRGDVDRRTELGLIHVLE